ncbi:MAG TPA: CdaR family protein [Candidatus Dormibacteraeota bacterium]|nr:CdaR family protein [Candidatus Dormibacteraeota bacterium]
MRVPGFATRNLRLKGVAAALAAVMWTGVAYASNPPDTRTVTIKVPQSDAAVAPWVLVHRIPDMVVRVSGTRAHLNAFDPADLAVSVNYKAITQAGMQNLPVSVTNNDRDVILDSPQTTIAAEVDRLDSRTVGVTVDVTTNPPQGYVVVSSSTNPSTVTVIGPRHELANVEARVSVNLGTQKTNFQIDAKPVLVDTSGQPLGNFGMTVAGNPQGEVLVTVNVAASLTSRSSAVLPKVGVAPPGHYLAAESVSPNTAVLTGPQDLLNTLDSIPTQSISLNGITGTQTFTVHIVTPAGVVATPGTVTVTITVDAIPQPSPTPTPTPPPPTPTATP